MQTSGEEIKRLQWQRLKKATLKWEVLPMDQGSFENEFHWSYSVTNYIVSV